MRRFVLFASLFACFSLTLAKDEGLPPGIKNTQDPRDVPPTPQEAVRRFKAPEGFRVSLFVGEPQVCQPIALAFDDRGRLWVAECFSYPNWQPDGKGQDRILIFEDTDGDGTFDKRTVFWDKAYNLTGLAVGHGGIWACCAPHLLFIPLRDGDVAGKPEVVLDGWSLRQRPQYVQRPHLGTGRLALRLPRHPGRVARRPARHARRQAHAPQLCHLALSPHPQDL